MIARLLSRFRPEPVASRLPPPDPSYNEEVMLANLAIRKAGRPQRSASALKGAETRRRAS